MYTHSDDQREDISVCHCVCVFVAFIWFELQWRDLRLCAQTETQNIIEMTSFEN